MPTDEDWAFFHRCEDGLQALYAGKWVLIHQGRLVDAYERIERAFETAAGLGQCLISSSTSAPHRPRAISRRLCHAMRPEPTQGETEER